MTFQQPFAMPAIDIPASRRTCFLVTVSAKDLARIRQMPPLKAGFPDLALDATLAEEGVAGDAAGYAASGA